MVTNDSNKFAYHEKNTEKILCVDCNVQLRHRVALISIQHPRDERLVSVAFNVFLNDNYFRVLKLNKYRGSRYRPCPPLTV